MAVVLERKLHPDPGNISRPGTDTKGPFLQGIWYTGLVIVYNNNKLCTIKITNCLESLKRCPVLFFRNPGIGMVLHWRPFDYTYFLYQPIPNLYTKQ